MTPQPASSEHSWLQKLVGDWTWESDCQMGPGQPPFKGSGRETVRPLGDYWIVAEGEGSMPGGGSYQMLITIGYDPAKAKFVGTFVASMMPLLWVYEGALDRAAGRLTLAAEGPSMTGDGSTSQYEDIVEIDATGERLFRARVRGADGSWNEFMVTRYKRA